MNNIPCLDNYFHSIRAERLIQVSPSSINTKDVIHELIRVTASGGRIVLLDTDWGSLSINCEDTITERALTEFFANELRPNGYAGRQLYSLAQQAGLSNIKIKIFPMQHFNLSATPVKWMVNEAAKVGILPAATLDAWLNELELKNRGGLYFSSVNMVVMSGGK